MKKYAITTVSAVLSIYEVIDIFGWCILYTFGVENHTEETEISRYNNSRKVSVFLVFVERGETGGR